MDLIEDILENPAVLILAGIGYGAFVAMLMILKSMGQKEIMPFWVKIVVLLFIPIAAYIFSKIFSSD